MKICVRICFLILIAGFSLPVIAQTKAELINASTGVQYQLIATYDVNKFNKIVSTELDAFLQGSPMPYADFKGQFPVAKYAVKLYRVVYKSVVPEMGNLPTIASGLIAIPETGLDSMPMVSYQHGTVFGKNQVPSIPDESMETKLMLAQFASQGYIVIGADYFGLGSSDLPNSYLIKSSSEQACVDMLMAARDILKAKKIKEGPFFVHGWSQGGWTNMTFLRKLETIGINVTAAASASAPVDAFSTMERWLNNNQPSDASWLVPCISNYLFATEFYNKIPGLAARAIRPQYYQLAKDFYEFKVDWLVYLSKVPLKAKDMLEPSFLASGNIGDTDFWQVLEKSQAYRWRCKTPLINYYGDVDEVVPVYIAKLPEGFHNVYGTGTTKAVSAGPRADHRATYVYSVIHVKPYFDSFLKKK